MRTLLSQLIKNKTVKHRKRICIDKQFNKQVKRYKMNQKIGIIAFLSLFILGVIALLIYIIGKMFVIAPTIYTI